MKDTRLAFFRNTLEGLIESLDATIRMRRWDGVEEVPAPIKESASRLVTCLGTADRLVSSSFTGSIADTARVNAMLGAMRRLDAAYVAYRRQLDLAPDGDTAAAALSAEIDDVRSDRRWRV
jgi:hypothetical protein